MTLIKQEKKRKIKPMHIGERKIVLRQRGVPSSIVMISLSKLAIGRHANRKK